jgi:hypothetical protein
MARLARTSKAQATGATRSGELDMRRLYPRRKPEKKLPELEASSSPGSAPRLKKPQSGMPMLSQSDRLDYPHSGWEYSTPAQRCQRTWEIYPAFRNVRNCLLYKDLTSRLTLRRHLFTSCSQPQMPGHCHFGSLPGDNTHLVLPLSRGGGT